MPIDVTPNTVATNALQALDFSSLIGGPMDAIVKAQALAAKTTYDFINEVCLTIDPDTNEKKPVNVTFTYNNNGQMATLTVPLLVILTIPSIEVREFTIDFIANISASSSSTEETSSDTELGVDASAEASLGIGPFSIKVKADANYSSKQHSKAAQDSKYSVEYTMNVNVQGGQSDMPTGLQTVLNILQGSTTSVSIDDIIDVYPANLNIDRTNSGTLQVTVKDSQGYLVKGTVVDITIPPTNPDGTNNFSNIDIIKGSDVQSMVSEVAKMKSGQRLNITKDVIKAFDRRDFGTLSLEGDEGSLTASAITDRKGEVQFRLTTNPNLEVETQGKIKIDVAVPVPNSDKTDQEILDYVYTIVPSTDPIEDEPEPEPPENLAVSDNSKTESVTAASKKDK